jgi:anti-anti-sigma factor
MSIDSSPENLVVVNLPRELEGHSKELQTVVEMVRHTRDRDVVVDFSNTDVVGSLTFSRLLELRRQVRESRHKLVLCGVAPAAKAVFSVASLDKLFDFAEDQPAALASLQGCA